MGEDRMGIVRIGTPAGWVKSSSGYAFRNIQYECDRLIEALKKKPFRRPVKTGRFDRYDRILLHVLVNQTYPGAKAFVDLFEQQPPDRVLRFLDEDSKLGDEFKIISRSKPVPFLKGLVGTMKSR